MATPATDAQVQNFVTTRLRPRAEQIRALFNAMQDDRAAINDIYAALTQPSPTWKDADGQNPPHLLAPNDVLAMNTFWANVVAAIQNDPQLGIVLSACRNALN